MGNKPKLQWNCKKEVFRLYHERPLNCETITEECPLDRMNSHFIGVKYGLFTPITDQRIIAWPRFSTCTDWGCQSGAWAIAKMKQVTEPKLSISDWNFRIPRQ